MPEAMYLDWLISARADGESYYKTDTAAPRFDPRRGMAPFDDLPMQSLTNGYYDECPLCDSLIVIGEVRLNTNTGKIVGFIKRDTLRSEATMEPTVVSRWLSVDPVVHPYESPYAAFANNPIWFMDPDGRDVIPTNALKANKSVNDFFKVVSQNTVFRRVMKSFYADENHVYIHLAQLKDSKGNPSSFLNTARTQSHLAKKTNPVAKYGMHRMIINSDILNSKDEIALDKTFLLRTFIHEGQHARMFERLKQDPNFESYPGHKDYVVDRFKEGGHHNQMAVANRNEMIEAMKEYDNMVKNQGGSVPSYHTEDWYQAMS